jgi:hypothetical protein
MKLKKTKAIDWRIFTLYEDTAGTAATTVEV